MSFEDIINYFSLNPDILKIKDYKTNYINPYNTSNPTDYKVVCGDSDISVEILKQKTKTIKDSHQQQSSKQILELILYQLNMSKTGSLNEIPINFTKFIEPGKCFENFKIKQFDKFNKEKNRYNFLISLWKIVKISGIPLGFVLEVDGEAIFIVDQVSDKKLWIAIKLTDNSYDIVNRKYTEIEYDDIDKELYKTWNISSNVYIGQIKNATSIFRFDNQDLVKYKSNELLDYCKKWNIKGAITENISKIRKEDLYKVIANGF
jgi:hypothetical protein